MLEVMRDQGTLKPELGVEKRYLGKELEEAVGRVNIPPDAQNTGFPQGTWWLLLWTCQG